MAFALAAAGLEGCPQESLGIVRGDGFIYFLMRQGEIVYVGQTTCLMARIGSHVKKRDVEDFDDVRYIRVPPNELVATENKLIHVLRPKLNGGKRRGVNALTRFLRPIIASATNIEIPETESGRRELIDMLRRWGAEYRPHVSYLRDVMTYMGDRIPYSIERLVPSLARKYRYSKCARVPSPLLPSPREAQ